MQPVFGFREHAHTADWELEVWAPDLPSLLEQAARGMYALSGVRLAEGPHRQHLLVIPAPDPESLLVQFLSNLLWLEESEHMCYDQFKIKVLNDDAYKLMADMGGSPIIGMDKEIKAVTYHNLKVQSTPEGLRVVIVFDV